MPDMPDMPNTPEIPNIPVILDVASIPGIFDVPNVPDVPKVLATPEVLPARPEAPDTGQLSRMVSEAVESFLGTIDAFERNSAQPIPGFARGGSFRVGGSGGTDNVPVNFFAKPGEIVSVQRPDQMMSGTDGGGGGVVINQTNNFEGGISDPAILIPILEENNRKLKGDILDGFDRGTFG